MQKYIEIEWLQDVDTILRNASPYISNANISNIVHVST